ncbi:sentrin-specific protease 3 isoform X1 [Selaginella moellendorffii]|uniref:sentrin-specific protease 3 isoform X1 n=1 Tax=Selaginella moellendorffii TaxID=88036 RepID=UPI000D1D0E64|nr:sentrin-specific protease 3 isoform X1 [Selaginella moellendorffii]XP_024528394.1 sentrin-specific protease 3 isoform X1 [Selaginella moellendorffii]XP_024528395.1 sentrin-specific protease 3 isoform X1 [Selaginella moellendorffii]|eukprot:XP_024528393.1 sentrin-specific protease 3 isoform X1 [Selaginella moellendorffii]
MAPARLWRIWRWRFRFFWLACIDRAGRRARIRSAQRVERKKDAAAAPDSLGSVARAENAAPIWQLPNGEGIAGRDLALLVDGKWLNSEIINSYFSLIKVRSDRLYKNSSSKFRTHCFSSFFYTKLQIAGYEGVRRWTKNINIFDHDLLLFPVNHNNVHWSLVAAHLKNHRIEYYDSLLCKSKTKAYIRIMKSVDEYLREEGANKHSMTSVQNWQLCVVDNIPQQTDGSSCGVFICAYAEHLTRGQSPPFYFSSSDIYNIQAKMTTQMLRGFIP